MNDKIPLFSVAYCPPVDYVKQIVDSDKIIIEKWDNFQKQTYRTRCYLYSPNGKQMLNVPIRHTRGNKYNKQLITEVEIDYSENWQKQHLKTLETCYRSSPYYEFYEHKILKFYKEKFQYLFDYNISFLKVILGIINVDIDMRFTEKYESRYLDDIDDLRDKFEAKNDTVMNPYKEYYQIFSSKHGFIPNLSILDLIFMKGNNTLEFLL